ncbi:flagellar basal body-associated protein FliL [Candidatus Methylospira mobilis]|uniref:Flagellar protein FliL n=1 Tax=Candidatus Methylospira mobilis TaxID=1808979 RepID=A0A5Q0BFF5_9GAMM|nr:flagellar basal body-associated protein FliL [Candidatus Methylospira mobilis]QFY41862.1 flagellar basal body-associated protein FliL [Candidatus Methylospira mobilis]WNV06738.1 flagellar basal body-associated protein FliL [Candidatus Methylospira mobilis]
MELLELDDEPLNKRDKFRKPLLIGLAVLVLLAAVGGGVWYFVSRSPAVPEQESTEKETSTAAPVFFTLEPFIVNLQPSPIGKRMQITLSLQVSDEEQAEKLKQFNPEVRSRLLILLSSKAGSDISTTEGKTVLANEIIEQINQPFTGRKDAQEVTAVFFTSFVIQ